MLTRHKIAAHASGYDIAVGYDLPTATLFIQVFRSSDDDPIVDATPDTVEELVAIARPFGRVPPDVQRDLRTVRNRAEYIPGLGAALRKQWDSQRFFDRNAGSPRSFHVVETESCTAYFDDMQRHFLDCIRAHDVALCAVYSLSDQKIINALAALPRVSVLVDEKQKSANRDYGALLDHEGVPAGIGTRIELYRDDDGASRARHDPLEPLVFVPSPEPRRGRRTHESFHTKFCVFGDLEANDYPDDIPDRFILPRAVWVGSYNPTPTGDRSIQSAVLLRERQIVLGFTSEYFALHRAALAARRALRVRG